MDEKPAEPTSEQRIIRELSSRLITAQRTIRILDSLKWGPEVKAQFFADGFRELPRVDANYYQNNPLPFNAEEKRQEFYTLERDLAKQLGKFSGVSVLMQRMSREYRTVLRMLEARGTSEFTEISQSLFGSAEDAFYIDGPNVKDLAVLLADTLPTLELQTHTEADDKRYTSQEAVEILSERLALYFGDESVTHRVEVSDSIIADAAAGAEVIKIRSDATFSERELRALEVHEGWVHLGTTLNGLNQPYCTFLSKGPPSSTLTQEGLAVIMELFTFCSYPARLRKLIHRIIAIDMAERGANFLEVFNFFLEHHHDEEASYASTVRVFRGSTPEGGPFTKDLVYTKGFVMIYNYIRLAIQNGRLQQIPLLFVGKTTLEDLSILSDLEDQGLIVRPTYLPPQFKDLAALASWMSYSLFMNRLNLQKLAKDLKGIIGG